MPVDPRIDAVRADLADVRLADRVFAPHYAAAVLRTASRSVPITAADGTALSCLLAGEPFELLEIAGGRGWGVSPVDGTVGYVADDALTVAVSATHVVYAADAVTAGGRALTMGERLSGSVDGADLVIAGDRVPLAALAPLDAPSLDIASLAGALVGTTFVAGGRSGAGVDADGLVALVLSVAGLPTPRFADLQAQVLGHPVDASAPILPGDLLFPEAGGAAIAVNGDHVVHAMGQQVERAPVAVLGAIAVRRRLP